MRLNMSLPVRCGWLMYLSGSYGWAGLVHAKGDAVEQDHRHRQPFEPSGGALLDCYFELEQY